MATIRGTSGNDTLIGDDPIDIIYGYGGNDFLYGSDGRDTLYGGDGQDWLRTKGDSEVLFGGAGQDTVLVIDGNNTRIDLRITGLKQIGWGDTGLVRLVSVESIATSYGNDSLNGNDQANSFSTAEGNDTVFGHGGDDFIATGWGNDRAFGGSGNDLITSDRGDDRLFGGIGNDQLNGGVGRDLLYGGEGSDRLTGGSGQTRDDFVFMKTTESRVGVVNRDVVTDFQRNLDELDVRQIDANAARAGDQAFSFAGTTSAPNSIWYNVISGHTHVFADTTGDRIADMELRLLNVNGLASTDFLL